MVIQKTQPRIKCLVISDNVMGYDHVYNRWHHWSPLMMQSYMVLCSNQLSASSALFTSAAWDS